MTTSGETAQRARQGESAGAHVREAGPAIDVADLVKRYGEARGVEGVTFEVSAGEVFGFVGPNGAGKSTTIRVLFGFLRPTSGSARIFGLDVVDRSLEVKRRCGYVPAEVHLYEEMRAGEVLDFTARLHGIQAGRRVNDLSERLTLDLARKVRELSTGNRKKLGIVQALLHEPELLVLDEPTAGLDPIARRTLFEILREENERGATILFSSHVLSEVQQTCDRVAILREGRVVAVEDIDQLRAAQYKRVRVRLGDAAQHELLRPRARGDVVVDGDVVEFLFQGSADELIAELARHKVEDLWVEDPSLEEVIIDFYTGERG